MAKGRSAIKRDTITQALKMLKHSNYPVFTVIESRAYKSAQRTGAAPAAALPVEAIFNRRPAGRPPLWRRASARRRAAPDMKKYFDLGRVF